MEHHGKSVHYDTATNYVLLIHTVTAQPHGSHHVQSAIPTDYLDSSYQLLPQSPTAMEVQQPATPTETRPRLLVLCKELQAISEQWRDIGLYLDLEEGELRKVECTHGSTPFKCMKEMLTVWLARKKPPPTWAAIIDVLEFLEHEKLALTLKQKAARTT